MIQRDVNATWLLLVITDVVNDFRLSSEQRAELVRRVDAKLSTWLGLSTLEARLDVRSAIRSLGASL